MRIIATPMFVYPIGDNEFKYEVRLPEEFYRETFSFPEALGLPTDRIETTTFIISGDMQSGKTYAVHYFASICKSIWGENIDFFECDDIFSTIEAVRASDKYAHFIFIDDAIKKGFDVRTSMHRTTISTSEKYLIIRHMIRDGYLNSDATSKKCGYVIIAIASQIFTAIDKRIRKHCSFTLFKTYDEECEEKIKNPELIDFLKLVGDQSTRVKDWRYRAYGVAVAKDDLFTPVLIPHEFEDVEFIKVKADSLIKLQKEECIKFLLKYNLEGIHNNDLKGALHMFLDEMVIRYRFCEISSGMFGEIIYRARIINKAKQFGKIENVKLEDYLDKIDEYLRNIENGEEQDQEADKIPTLVEGITYALRRGVRVNNIRYPFADFETIMNVSGGDYGSVRSTLNSYNKFIRIFRNHFCLALNKHKITDEMIEEYQRAMNIYKEPLKRLEGPILTLQNK